ncbi:hypothetical protein ACHQM5_029679 [Ranunculus cassubicifolius]
MGLMEKRDSIEIEMNIIIDRLSHPDAPGITGNLIDPDGFPRSDLDVPAVRADRRRLSAWGDYWKEREIPGDR